MNKKKIILTSLFILLLIGIVVGTTYAVFTFTKTGEKNNQVRTATVTMDYTEGQNRINITNATPITDEAGKALSNNDQVFDFTVNITMSTSQNISYEVTAEKIPYEENGLNNEDVKLYLEKSKDGTTYREVMAPTNYTEMGSDIDNFGAQSTEMRLDAGYVNKTTTYYYRLRMWVDEDYSMTDTVKYFTVKVNVYGKDGTIEVAQRFGGTYEPAIDKTYKGIMYLDPTDLSNTCNAELASSNVNNWNGTPTTIKTGCMKWYVYDDSGDKYTMILDHNTSENISANLALDNSSLPGLEEALRNDSAEWVSRLNPRAITANEVANITGNTSFDSTVTLTPDGSSTVFYFDSNSQTRVASSTRLSNYAWLFNYFPYCKNYGCEFVDNEAYDGSYWTSTPANTTEAWIVTGDGMLNYMYVNNEGSSYNSPTGVRPVISLSKSIVN